MTLKDVAAPAIRCARNGFGTSYTGALTMYDNSVERKMRLSEAFRKLYLKEDGSFYRFGEIQKNQEIADLLENSAEQGVDYFYKGKVAKQIVDKFAEYLGTALAIFTCVVDPEVIVIGGGVSKAGQPLIDAVAGYYKEHAFISCKDTPIVLAKLDNDAGIYGAAKLVVA